MKRRIRLLLLWLLAGVARPLVRRPRGSITSVLYLKPDHLGDLLLATPALAALRQRFPEARVAALVGPWSAMVLQRSPDIDVLLTCPFPGFERQLATTDHRPPTTEPGAGGWGIEAGEPVLVSSLQSPVSSGTVVRRPSSVVRPYLVLVKYALLLRATRYDLAIVGRDDHWWGAALALLAGVPRRVGFAVPECRPFLTTALPWKPRAHVTEQGLDLVAALDQETRRPGGKEARRQGDKETRRADSTVSAFGSPGLPVSRSPGLPVSLKSRFDPAQDDITWADRWIAEHGLADERLVMIHPGTGGPAKLWRPERWAEVADALHAGGARLLLTGGSDEVALVAEVAAHMCAPAHALAGQTSVGQLAALLRRAALVLGVDSGPLHLAAAQGVPTIHLYGPGDDRRFGPWGDPARHVVMRAELWCSPCGVFGACPRGLERPECMDLITATRVIAQAEQMLAA